MEAADQRQHIRLPFAVTVRLTAAGGVFEASSRDICSGGIAVTGPGLGALEAGTPCEFSVWLASGEETRTVRGTGEVVREVDCLDNDVEGIGIRFLNLDEGSQQVLWRLIRYNAPPAAPGVDGLEGGGP